MLFIYYFSRKETWAQELSPILPLFLSVYPISFHDTFPLVMRYENNILKQLMRWKPFLCSCRCWSCLIMLMDSKEGLLYYLRILDDYSKPIKKILKNNRIWPGLKKLRLKLTHSWHCLLPLRYCMAKIKFWRIFTCYPKKLWEICSGQLPQEGFGQNVSAQ